MSPLTPYSLVAGDAAVNDRLSACIDDDERELDSGVQCWGPLILMFVLPIPLHQVFEGYLLLKEDGCVGRVGE